MKIGVFDSGFGGLEIFAHIERALPRHDLVYFGDTARTPYGTRSQETIFKYTTEALDFLLKPDNQGGCDCGLVILACNTASAEALRKIQQEWLPNKFSHRKVLGVIIPATEEAASLTQNKKVGVIATESSVESEAFPRELKKLDLAIGVFQQACPLLVPLVEADEADPHIVTPILEKYLRPLVEQGIDTLILGCTHYGILRPEIAEALKALGSDARIISEGEIVARKLEEYLDRHNEIEANLSHDATRTFFSTDLTDKFRSVGARFLGHSIEVQKIDLEKPR